MDPNALPATLVACACLCLALIWPLSAAAQMQPLNNEEMQEIRGQAGIHFRGLEQGLDSDVQSQMIPALSPQVGGTPSTLLTIVDGIREESESRAISVSIRSGQNPWTDEPVTALQLVVQEPVVLEAGSGRKDMPSNEVMEKGLQGSGGSLTPAGGSGLGGFMGLGSNVYHKPGRIEVRSGKVQIWPIE